jgi:hypothetical protein
MCIQQSAFAPLMDAAIMAAIRRVLMEGIAENPGSAPREMVASAVSCALYGASKEWFRTPNHPPAEKIAPLILQLVMPMLAKSGMKP